MKPLRKKIGFILLSLLMLGAIGFYYLNNIFLPVKFKGFLEEKATEFLHRPVTIGAIRFKLLNNVIIENVKIHRKHQPDQIFAKFDHASFNILLIAFLKQKIIIIPTLKINAPYIYALRKQDTTWNFSDLQETHSTPSSMNKEIPPLIIKQLIIKNGNVEYTDFSQMKEFFESFKSINADITLNLNKTVQFEGSAHAVHRNSSFIANGYYDISTQKIISKMSLTNVYFARYFSLFYPNPSIRFSDGIIASAKINLSHQRQGPLQIKGNFILNDTHAIIGDNKHLTGNITANNAVISLHNKILKASGSINIPSAKLLLPNQTILQGDLNADITSLVIKDNTVSSEGKIHLKHALLEIDKNTHFEGNITSQLDALHIAENTLTIKGGLSVDKTLLKLASGQSIEGQLTTTATQFTYHFNEQSPSMNLKTALTLNETEIILDKGFIIQGDLNSSELNLTSEKNKWNLNSQIKSENLNISLKEKNFQGHPEIKITYQYTSDDKPKHNYTATAILTTGTLTGIPSLNEIHEIEGKITLKPDEIHTEELNLISQEAHLKLSGNLNNFAEPTLDLNVSSDNLDLTHMAKLFSNHLDKFNINISGIATAQGHYKGLALTPQDADITVTAQLNNATISDEKGAHTVNYLSGDLHYSKDLLSWKNLIGTYRDKSYTLNGHVENFSRPALITDVSSEDLAFSSKIKLLHSAIRILEAKGNYAHSSFDLKGDMHFKGSEHTEFDLRGLVVFDLKDMPTFFPNLKNKVAHLNPIGQLSAEGLAKGTLQDWHNWQMTFDARSAQMTIGKIPFYDILFQFEQNDQNINKLNVSSHIYDGEININTSFDLRDKDLPGRMQLNIAGLDLELYRKEQKIKNRHLAGKLNIHANLKGPVLQHNELHGTASVSITDGFLGQLIPQLDKAYFTSATGDFTIRNKKLFTKNTRAYSQTMDLKAEGWIGFDKTIDFMIYPDYSKLEFAQTDKLKFDPSFLLKEVINIKCTGTINKRNCRGDTSPGKVIGQTTDILKEGIKGIGGILEDLF